MILNVYRTNQKKNIKRVTIREQNRKKKYNLNCIINEENQRIAIKLKKCQKLQRVARKMIRFPFVFVRNGFLTNLPK